MFMSDSYITSSMEVDWDVNVTNRTSIMLKEVLQHSDALWPLRGRNHEAVFTQTLELTD